jgi:hypothetical protein
MDTRRFLLHLRIADDGYTSHLLDGALLFLLKSGIVRVPAFDLPFIYETDSVRRFSGNNPRHHLISPPSSSDTGNSDFTKYRNGRFRGVENKGQS